MIPVSGRPFDVGVLKSVEDWGASTVAIALVDADGLVARHGPPDRSMRWASITKMLTAYVVLIAERRALISLDERAGPPGATVRHLLAHASGLPFDETVPISPPARTRIYSNAGFDTLAGVVFAAAGRPFQALLREWVFDPLGMDGARLLERPSQGVHGTLDDLVAFAAELLRPRLLPVETLELATSVAFPGLGGVLPGVGRFDPLDWGLGFELRDGKQPHWTGSMNSPATFGHFGGSGTFLWVDPEADLALACLTDREYDDWALEAWPAISDAVLAAAAG